MRPTSTAFGDRTVEAQGRKNIQPFGRLHLIFMVIAIGP
jgi:hypothetical protein